MANDFRDYRAAFVEHQEDLMHYGVKGMRWHHHKDGYRNSWISDRLKRWKDRFESAANSSSESNGSAADRRRNPLDDTRRRFQEAYGRDTQKRDRINKNRQANEARANSRRHDRHEQLVKTAQRRIADNNSLGAKAKRAGENIKSVAKDAADDWKYWAKQGANVFKRKKKK